MDNIIKKIKEKNGNSFIIALLIVFAGISFGTIILTYQDFKTDKLISQNDIELDKIEVMNSSLIIEQMNNEEIKFQQNILENSNKDIENSTIAANQNLKTILDFGTIGNATITEQYIDENECIYLCTINLSNNKEYIKITINKDEMLSMIVIDENGKEVQKSINLPLSISEQIVLSIKEMYNIRKGV